MQVNFSSEFRLLIFKAQYAAIIKVIMRHEKLWNVIAANWFFNKWFVYGMKVIAENICIIGSRFNIANIYNLN